MKSLLLLAVLLTLPMIAFSGCSSPEPLMCQKCGMVIESGILCEHCRAE